MSKQRLDEVLVEHGFYSDVDAALRGIIAGEVLVDDVAATSASQLVSSDASVRLRKDSRSSKRYVSRGGEKLKGAIDAFGIDVGAGGGLTCLDIGSSTGGFTDCLLQEGAASVACVDVNYGQLAWEIRTDPRVNVFERTNIRKVSASDIGGPFDLIVIDVSFIGLAQLAADIARFAKEGTQLLALVKPQFESKRGETERGIVRDDAIRERTVEEVREALADNGFETMGYIESPIKGRSGNIEYLLHAVLREG